MPTFIARASGRLEQSASWLLFPEFLRLNQKVEEVLNATPPNHAQDTRRIYLSKQERVGDLNQPRYVSRHNNLELLVK